MQERARRKEKQGLENFSWLERGFTGACTIGNIGTL